MKNLKRQPEKAKKTDMLIPILSEDAILKTSEMIYVRGGDGEGNGGNGPIIIPPPPPPII
jgi:hypothetical protein